MKKTESRFMIANICGVTAKIEIEKGEKRKHMATFVSIEEMVEYMVYNDVIHKSANIGEDLYSIDLEKTDEANENWYENEMGLSGHHVLPTNMFK